jgi:hypothetical protein
VVKRPVTVELDEAVVRAAEAEAERTGQSEAQVIEEALREHLSLAGSVVDGVWARTGGDALSEEESLALAYDELKAMRRERGESGKAAS